MKLKTAGALALTCGMLVAGCAQKAELIEPSQISPTRYAGWSCSKLGYEMRFVEDALSRVSSAQDRASKNDALMVFLIGVPTSGGGVPGEVARLKGEREAVRMAMRDRGCEFAPSTSVGTSDPFRN